eukprot:GILK01012642.1.p1 GENE.GILK01012642.1~~GILK01012642.1.p1  ORF type:complete len:564 (-),score=89.55 GILK01012642.1:49-1740(-)
MLPSKSATTMTVSYKQGMSGPVHKRKNPWTSTNDTNLEEDKPQHLVEMADDPNDVLNDPEAAQMFRDATIAQGQRIIVCVDLDYFYVQVEEVRQPALKGKPVGVTQKYLVVTCNYEARAYGVTKLMGIAEAQEKCPHIHLIRGEDLTPYREASSKICQVISELVQPRGGVVQKASADEMFIDLTTEVRNRIDSGEHTWNWQGHVKGKDVGVTASQILTDAQRQELELMVGSQIASEIRGTLLERLGYTSCAGIARNKLLAKLASNMHKPNNQTVFLPSAADSMLPAMAARQIPGVGWRLHQTLRDIGVKTVDELQRLSLRVLRQYFAPRIVRLLLCASRGVDPSPVEQTAAPRTISVEDSFATCSSMDEIDGFLRALGGDLIVRIDSALEEFGVSPQSLVLKLRYKEKQNSSRVSRQVPMPTEVVDTRQSLQNRLNTLFKVSRSLFLKTVETPFNLTLLNLGAINLKTVSNSAPSAITNFFGRNDDAKTSLEVEPPLLVQPKYNVTSQPESRSEPIQSPTPSIATAPKTQSLPQVEPTTEPSSNSGSRSIVSKRPRSIEYFFR